MSQLLLLLLSLFTSPKVTPTPIPIPTPIIQTLLPPSPDFTSRVTKKTFGTYVNPRNSPVSPEVFTGYHSALDIEYPDILDDLPITAVAEGKIIYSGIVSGYGGFVAQQIFIENVPYIATYGHLRPSTMVKAGTVLKAGESVGLLGTGYTPETDNERRHLHFAILKGTKLDFRGYVQKQSELSLWLNPLTLYP